MQWLVMVFRRDNGANFPLCPLNKLGICSPQSDSLHCTPPIMMHNVSLKSDTNEKSKFTLGFCKYTYFNGF